MDTDKKKFIKNKLGHLGIKLYKNRYRIAFIVLIVALLIFFFGSNTVKIVELTKQKHQLQDDIAYEEQRAKALEEELATVGEKAYIERIAREKLNMYYPDESIVTIEYSDALKNVQEESEEKHE